MAAEAKRVIHDHAHFLFFRFIGGVIEVALRIRVFQIDRWRNNAVANRQCAGGHFYRAGAAKLFPDKRVVCGLVFTDGPRLLQLSDVVLDAQIAGISARLTGPP